MELTNFFLEAQIVPPQQHDFLPKNSIFTNIKYRLQEWTLSDDIQEPVDIVYLDFEKAFDNIPIPYLLYKLEHFGVRGDLLRVLEGFLTGRSFQVRVGTTLSGV